MEHTMQKERFSLLSAFDDYPMTQAALKTLQLRNRPYVARCVAKTIQLIAHQPIEGKFSVTLTEAE
jgi:hypothetical protein